MSRIASSASLALLVGIAACGGSDDRSDGELGQRIAEPTTLAIRASSSADIRGVDPSGHDVEVGPLVVTGGEITVQRTDDDRIVVQHLVVQLGDVVVDDGELVAHPVTLTHVAVSLDGELVLDHPWSVTGESARGGARGLLHLDWSQVRADGQVVPLRDQRFFDAPLGIELVAEADGSVSAHVSAELRGTLMTSWGIELRDFAMDLAAGTP